jgi:trehalose 6-phosphate synthase/phosphatase
VAETLKGALALPEEERRERIRPMREHLLRYDARHWARSFIEDLESGAIKDAGTAKSDIKDIRELVARTLAEGKRIALFLDYDGTLREIERELSALTANHPIKVRHGKKMIEVTAS